MGGGEALGERAGLMIGPGASESGDGAAASKGGLAAFAAAVGERELELEGDNSFLELARLPEAAVLARKYDSRL